MYLGTGIYTKDGDPLPSTCKGSGFTIDLHDLLPSVIQPTVINNHAPLPLLVPSLTSMLLHGEPTVREGFYVYHQTTSRTREVLPLLSLGSHVT